MEFRNPPWHYQQVFSTLAEYDELTWGQKLVDLPEAWTKSRGAGVKIAVLDTGCQLDHPDLKDQILGAKDFSGSAYGPEDQQGHGTHCAGIIAAANDDHGSIGVAPDLAKSVTENKNDYTIKTTHVSGGGLYIAKVLGDNGFGSHQKIADGINWSVEKKVDIISMSLGSRDTSPPLFEAINNAIDAGVFVICAAGNDGKARLLPSFPANMGTTIAVGAVGKDSIVADYSSRGAAVDIAAPGSDIMSTFTGSGYAVLSGTSMATPFVAGVAALIISKHKRLGGKSPVESQEHLREHMNRYAIDLGETGEDDNYGSGLINPVGMLRKETRPSDTIDVDQLKKLLTRALNIVDPVEVEPDDSKD